MQRQTGYVSSGLLDGVLVDEDDYNYSIAFPIFLSWSTGNLGVGSGIKKIGEEFEDGKALYVESSALIIWMNPFYGGVKEVGVILVQQGDDGEYISNQIYLKDNQTARNRDAQKYVDEGQEEINRLFQKAETEWEIELPWKK